MASESSPLRSEIFEEHAGFVRRLAKSLVRDESRADDVAQSTWLAALENPPSHEGGLRGWFALIVRNLARKTGRSERRRDQRERSVARGERTTSVADTLARQSVLRQVTDAVLALDEPYRTTVMLSFYEGLSSSEIADELGVPEATIRSRKQRALAKLRERLDHDNDGSRNAWCSALVSLVAARKWAETATASAATASTMTIGEALLMSTKLKVIGGGALACLAALAAWNFSPDREVEADTLAAIAPTDTELAAEAIAEEEHTDDDVAAEREAVEAQSESEVVTLPATGLASLTINVTWEADGRPVPNEPLQLLNWNVEPGRRVILTKTDAAGTARLENILPGSMVVTCGRAGGYGVKLEAGEDKLVELEIPLGFTINGIVKSKEGHAVPGARVWLSEYFNYSDGSYLATTDLDGRFTIEHAGESRYLGAVAEGHSPSHLHFLPDLRGSAGLDTPTEIELVLTGEGGSLSGIVRMPDGAPAVRSFVEIEGNWPRAATNEKGDRLWYAPTSQLVTDHEGRFEVDGLAPGDAKLRVLGARCSPHEGVAMIEAGRRASVEIDLVPQCVVHGTVTLPSGEPAVGVTVRQDVRYEPTNPSSKTDAAGRFRVEGLPAGSTALFVEVKDVGRAERRFELQAGDEVEWNAVIDAGRVLEGRVLNEDGEPFVGWKVSALIPNDFGTPRPWRQKTVTDAEGRFNLVECPEDEFRVNVYSPDNWIQEIVSATIAVDQRDVELRVEANAMPTSGIKGTLVATDGSPIAATLQAWLDGLGRAEDHASDPKTGEFTISNMRPGTYMLYARPTDMPNHCVGEFELEPNKVLDVGELELAEPGRLLLTVAGEKDFGPFGSIQITQLVEGDAQRFAAHSWNGGDSVEAFELMPGRYRLRAMSGSVASEYRDFDVHSAQDTLIDLEAREGYSVNVSFAFADGVVAALDGFSAEISGADGIVPEPVHVIEGKLYPLHLRLVPGEYVARGESADGWVGEREFEVVADARETQNVVVVMGN